MMRTWLQRMVGVPRHPWLEESGAVNEMPEPYVLHLYCSSRWFKFYYSVQGQGPSLRLAGLVCLLL